MSRRMIVALNVALALFALLAIAVAYVRLAPNPVSLVHVDPVAAGRVSANSAFVAPPDAPVFDATPEEVFAALDEIILATPKTRRWAEGPDAFHASYIVRTPLVGFPDYVSVRVLPTEGGATYAIYSRSRFGRSDLGANAARIGEWRGALAERFATP